MDLQKAFDNVNLEILLNKAYSAGIRGVQYTWLKNYLSNRKQAVKIGNNIGKFVTIKKGVPQGSVLGPILFLIYINDLGFQDLKGKLFMFVDDTALIYAADTENDLIGKINSDVKKLRNWLENNELSMNFSKTTYIHFILKKDNRNSNLTIKDHSINCTSLENCCCLEIK